MPETFATNSPQPGRLTLNGGWQQIDPAVGQGKATPCMRVRVNSPAASSTAGTNSASVLVKQASSTPTDDHGTWELSPSMTSKQYEHVATANLVWVKGAVNDHLEWGIE